MVLGGACHPLDLLRWLVGDIVEVHAIADKQVGPG
jgi:predicted dehydrogenase